MSDLKITFTSKQNKEINKKIDEFVNNMGGSINYYNKNRRASKAKDDIFLGKKAEYFALYALHTKCNFPVINLDMEIRKGKAKGWQCDLPFHETYPDFPNVHVKGCNDWTYNYCNDYSWSFQYSNKNGRNGRDIIFSSPETDLVALVYVENARDPSGIVKKILPWEIAKNYLKDPISRMLVGLKKCLYFKDIQYIQSCLEVQ